MQYNLSTPVIKRVVQVIFTLILTAGILNTLTHDRKLKMA